LDVGAIDGIAFSQNSSRGRRKEEVEEDSPSINPA
jgi:hypothetical protein